MIQYELFALAFFCCLTVIRIIIGPTIWDRLLGLNLVLSKILMIITIYAVIFQKSYLLDVALSYALLGFISTLFIAGFIRKRGKL